MGISLPNSFSISGQSPVDDKSIALNLVQVTGKVEADPNYKFTLYKGLKIYLQEEGKEIIFEQINPENSSERLMSSNITYPEGSIYEGYNYHGKEFNFFNHGSPSNLTGDYS